MGLIEFLLLCALVGILLFLLQKTGAIEPTIMKLMVGCTVVVLVLYFLAALGLLPFHDVPIPRVR